MCGLAELEDDEAVINWSVELTDRLAGRLYPLWNRTAGDCLLDSVLQATYGVFDRDNTLRRAMADSLSEAAAMSVLSKHTTHCFVHAFSVLLSLRFYPRWKDSECRQAATMHYSLDEGQWQEDWMYLLNLASQPGSSLEQIHVFALAHVLRRPIIIYGIKFVKSFRGDNLGFARFQGL